MSNKLTCRLVQEGELESIQTVSKGVYTFDGKSLDYLPEHFLRWTSSSNHYIYGLYENGVLVAAKCESIFDNGKTIYSQALRVSIHRRNLRYSEKLENLGQNIQARLVLPRYPIERIRYAKGGVDPDVQQIITKQISNAPERIKTMCVRSSFTATINGSDLATKFSKISTHSSSSKITVISAREAFEFAIQFPDLFPAAALYTDWDAHDITYENLLILESGGLGNYERRFLKLEHSNGEVAFAILAALPKNKGMTWALDTFTKNATEVLLFSNFLLQNKENLRTYHSLEEPKFVWIWLPYEQEGAQEIQNILSLIKDDPVHFLLRAVYFNEEYNREHQSKL